MKSLFSFTFLVFLFSAGVAWAGASDPLFINLTSDEPHRSAMALGFGASQLERGHPLTVFLNDKGVLLASKKNGVKFAQQQKMIADILAKGGVVYVCPTCSKKYGVQENDLAPGAKISNPDMTGGALFKDNTKVMSW